MAPNSTTPSYRKNIYFTIPKFQSFGEVLHDRLHGLVFHIEELDTRFTLITNLFDRDPKRIRELWAQDREDIEALMYCGTEKQRYILELEDPPYANKMGKNKKEWQIERNTNWEALKNRIITRDMDGAETIEYFDKFRDGKLFLADIDVRSLKDYFQSLDNVLQKNEYPIISDYFDIERDKYIGIPVLGLGLFQGITWIVFEKKAAPKFADSATVKRLIRLFQIEYDNLALNWELAGEGITKQSLIRDALNRIDDSNPIQKDCRIKLYYDVSEHYHRDRISQNEAVTKRVKKQYHKTATFSILLDSFVQNISIHSLATLSWWFKEYSEYTELVKSFSEYQFNPLILYAKVADKPNFSKELYPLFKFLMEKGAFWGGITRENNLTGETDNLFHLLWNEFIHNPLYLGTLAISQQVRKLYINITLYEKEVKEATNPFYNVKVIKKGRNGKLLDGTFATIDLEDFAKSPKNSERSAFVIEGPYFEELKPELQNCKAFFPGGVVGKHALFTLLENKIRNIKHFEGKALKTIQEEGLTLNISVQNMWVDTESTDNTEPPQFFKIGVWIKHPVEVSPNLLINRVNGLDLDIITDDSYQPKFGGQYHDKICASMLLTNSFHKVQDKSSGIGKIYYPWVKSAFQKIEEPSYNGRQIDFEVSNRKLKELSSRELFIEEFEKVFTPDVKFGYLKKYFHIWKAADIYTIEKDDLYDTEHGLENLARYQFIHLIDAPLDTYWEYRKLGLIRLFSKDTTHLRGVEEAYLNWLPIWLKSVEGNLDFVIDFTEGITRIGRITFWEKEKQISFENKEEIASNDADPAYVERYQSIPSRTEISLAHGTRFEAKANKIIYNSNGKFARRFCRGLSMEQLREMAPEDACELLEVIATHICIFDHQIYNRLNVRTNRTVKNSNIPGDGTKQQWQLKHLDLYREKLFLDFRDETNEDWSLVRSDGFLKYHFVILHLSFIKKLKNKDGSYYTEEEIIDFINEEVLQGKKPEEVKRDFILVIVAEGAQSLWWEKVKASPSHVSFTTYRPIESILEAFEDGIQMSDDIQLKYNLVKLLFGS